MSDSEAHPLSDNAHSQRQLPQGTSPDTGVQIVVDLHDELGLDVPADYRRATIEITRSGGSMSRVDVHGPEYRYEFESDREMRVAPARQVSRQLADAQPDVLDDVPDWVRRALDYLGFDVVARSE